MRIIRGTILLLAILCAPHVAAAAFPQPTGFVNDFAGVIQPGTRSQLEGMLSSVEARTGVEIAVVTVQSLDGRPIEDYAVDLYKTWGIGKKGKDEGALILVAPTDRQVRIEVGYGLEGALNDAKGGDIIRTAMIPFFKEGDFTKGIVAGTQAVAGIALKEKGVAATDEKTLHYESSTTYKSGGVFSKIWKILIIIVMIYLFIRHPWLFLLLLSSSGRSGGGGFGGGFGGFGGGLSGGGGASGRW